MWHPSSTWSAFLLNMPIMNLSASGCSCSTAQQCSVSSANGQALPLVCQVHSPVRALEGSNVLERFECPDSHTRISCWAQLKLPQPHLLARRLLVAWGQPQRWQGGAVRCKGSTHGRQEGGMTCSRVRTAHLAHDCRRNTCAKRIEPYRVAQPRAHWYEANGIARECWVVIALTKANKLGRSLLDNLSKGGQWGSKGPERQKTSRAAQQWPSQTAHLI